MTFSSKVLERAFSKILIKHRDKDPLTLAELLVDALELLTDAADEGDGSMPHMRIEREGAVRPEPPRPAVTAMPPPAKSALVLPGDKEFTAAASGAGLVLSKVGRNQRQEKLWTYEGITAILEKQTPPEVYFTPDGTSPETRVLAKRNILQLQGTDTVRIMYASPQMGEDSIQPGGDHGGGRCTVALVASKMFSLYDQSIDVPTCMEDILVQLRGLYRPRGKSMDPVAVGPDPGPLRGMADSPMGVNDDIRISEKWSTVANPQGSVLSDVINANRATGSPNGNN